MAKRKDRLAYAITGPIESFSSFLTAFSRVGEGLILVFDWPTIFGPIFRRLYPWHGRLRLFASRFS